MANITIHMKDGTMKEFREKGRAGGSYTNGIRYEPGFVVHRDEWGDEVAIPTDLIKEIKTENLRRGW